MLDVGARIGLGGVDLERDVGVALADHPGRLDVPARLDLELDPPIALGHVPIDLCDQRLDRVVRRDSGRDAAGDPVVDRAEVGGE